MNSKKGGTMIAINEANPDIVSIFRKHVAAVTDRVGSTIDFYEQLYEALPDIQKSRTTEETIKKKVFFIKNRFGREDYKALLNVLLKGKLTIKNETFMKRLKFKRNFNDDARDIPKVTAALISLKNSFKQILEMDFGVDQAAKILQYAAWKQEYAPIGFLLKKVFDYEDWFSKLEPEEAWGPYQLAIALNIRTCAYCNRHYTFSLTDSVGKKMGRPDFDHFMPKAVHPLLALSFYNLVPSCKECNGPSVKSSKPVDYASHLNPFEANSLNSLMRFSYHPRTYEASMGGTDELDVYLKYAGDGRDNMLKTKVEGNIKLFHLQDVYAHHNDTVQEIIRLRHISNDRHIEILQDTYKNFNLSREEAYRLAYGNYYQEKDFHKRPLSKLTKDIAIELQTLVDLSKT